MRQEVYAGFLTALEAASLVAFSEECPIARGSLAGTVVERTERLLLQRSAVKAGRPASGRVDAWFAGRFSGW